MPKAYLRRLESCERFAVLLALVAALLYGSNSYATAFCIAAPWKADTQADGNSGCHSQQHQRTNLPELSTIERLLRWIGENSDYDVSQALKEPPVVVLCNCGEVIEYEGRDVIVDEKLRAAYDLPNRKIFLVRPWSADDPRNVSTLLHELIHDIQFGNRYWECNNAPEWEAYKLQDRWLEQQGLASGFDWLEIYFLSKCPRDIHPD